METRAKVIDFGEFGRLHRGKIEPVRFFMPLGVGVIILAFLFYFVGIPEIARAFRYAQLSNVLFGALLLIPNVGMQVAKWHYMLKAAGERPTWRNSATSLLVGITLGSFTPAQVGEFFGRALRFHSGNAGQLVGLTIIDRLQTMFVILSAGIVALIYLLGANARELLSVGVLSILVIVVFLVRPSSLINILDRLSKKFTRQTWIVGLRKSFECLKPNQLIVTFAYSILFYLVLTAQMFFLMNAFVKIGWWESSVGFSAMMFSKAILPISIADVGIREAGAVYFFSFFNVSRAAALNAALLLFVLNILIPAFLGLFFLPNFHTISHSISKSSIDSNPV